MKGFHCSVGYMGEVNGRWMLFASQSDYHDYVMDDGEECDDELSEVAS